MTSAKPLVYAVSDSVGETAEMVVKAAISQFGSQAFETHRNSHVGSVSAIEEIFRQISLSGRRCLVCHTFVSQELRQATLEFGQQFGIGTVDLLGPILGAVEAFSGLKPELKPGLVHRLDEDYFRRIEAVEFSVKYDDGKDSAGIVLADLVLVGVSRTSKTPLSMFLAHKMVKVANVPLVPELAPPPELFQVPGRKIFGLVIDPFKLNRIRQERLRVLGIGEASDYADMARIEQELAYAQTIMRRLHCQVLDVSNKAIEETANLVLEMLRSAP